MVYVEQNDGKECNNTTIHDSFKTQWFKCNEIEKSNKQATQKRQVATAGRGGCRE